ncbi:MAG: heat-inducible transcription repressor HrcA [Clostridiales bacterium]|nr:heat-inducible transcription repressor HrcA [Clostridiales bacterium]
MSQRERKKEILRAVVDRYVDTAEPVGSKAISSELSLSSATIRNEMVALEEAGLLEQPHTSAGRVPTAAGYRMYVNEIMRQHKLSLEETEQLNRALERRLSELDRIISYASQTVSQFTSLPAYALSRGKANQKAVRFDVIEVDALSFILVVMLENETVKNKLFHMPETLPEGFLKRAAAVLATNFSGLHESEITDALIDASERACGDKFGVFAAIAAFLIEVLTEAEQPEYALVGGARLLDYPEFRDIDKAQKVLGFLSGEGAAPQLPAPDENARAKITIGPENLAEELRDSSVVVARYDMGDDTELLVGVVGPTRMDYPRVLSRLQYLARGLSDGKDPPGLPDDTGDTEVKN